jgi:predicted AAA+ superfamily ATPase
MINRIISKSIINKLRSGKVIILYGARQVGKTTLVEKLIEDTKDYLYFNADNIEDRLQLEQESATKFRVLFSDKKLIIIDEAQRVKNIGLNLKIIHDQLQIPIIATGSSAFELANNISESLTGRKHELHLYPLSFEELSKHFGVFEEYKNLQNRLIYGSYPEVVKHHGQQKEILINLASSYLYKDILEWNKIKKSDKLIKLLQALAFQIGNQVSYNELSQIVGINKETVENYIDLLEKSFVIFSLKSFNRNLRTELKKSKKIYFYDNGIRNALINNFNQLELRNDVGALWENYIISERYKYNSSHNLFVNCYFWRTKNQQEIDFIEEQDGKLYAYEFKWSAHKKAKIPIAFQKAYPDANIEIIRPDNYFDFLTKEKNH